jgi:hypothetical protein
MRRTLLLLSAMALALLLASGLALVALSPTARADGDCQPSGSQVVCTFSYTGAAQNWTVPNGVTQATFDVYGAGGGGTRSAGGGRGGEAKATISVTPGKTLQVNVGGRGGSGVTGTDITIPGGAGGFNGGAAGGDAGVNGGGTDLTSGGGGGGASDVRSGAFGLTDRLIVAGGGGGGGGASGASGAGFGGTGGGVTGGDGGTSFNSDGHGGFGGTDSKAGDGGAGLSPSFNGGNGVSGTGGRGATHNDGGGGGGGGGYWGGGGGGGGFPGSGGGGGGSGFCPAECVVFQNNVRSPSDNENGLVTITYTPPPVNDAPVNSVPGNQSTNEDTPLTFNSANSNSISISDVDAGTSPVKVTLAVSHGKLTLSGTSGLTFVTGDGTDDANMTFTGTIADINSALSGLTFDPDANYNGLAALSITTDDQGNIGSGGAKSDTDTVNLTVNSVNNAPVANDGTASGAEDGNPIQINLGTLVNDVETQDANLTYTIVKGPTAQQGTLTADPNTAGVYSFDSAQDFNGFFDIFYTVTDRGDPDNCQAASPEPAQGCDATETSLQKKVTVTVNAVNDPPTANAQSLSTDEDTAQAITLTGDDVDGDTLTSYSIVSGPAHGTLTGTAPDLTYTPAGDYNGPDSFTFTVNDGKLDSAEATASITVKPVNDPPTCKDVTLTTNEDTQGSISPDCSDVDGDGLTYKVADLAAHGTASVASGKLNYDPDPNTNGSDSFTYKANDGTVDSAPAKVDVTVTPVNDVPEVFVAAGGSCGTNDRSGTINLTLSDPEGTAMSLTLVDNTNRTLVPNTNVVLGGTGANRTLTATAVSGRTGTAVLSVRIAEVGGATGNVVALTVKVDGNGSRTTNGTAGTDLLFGQNGDDTLNGLEKNDLLCGGRGNDRLTGGTGADHFGGGSGTDTATDFNNPAGQGDTQSGIP